MAETKIYIDDEIDKKLREAAMARFGYGRGSISNAAEEALIQWLRRDVIIKKRLNAIIEIAKKDKNSIAVLLFGSYARKEHDYMDVDVAILVERKPESLHELTLYAPEDTEHENIKMDVVILNQLPLDVQRRVLNEAEVLYVKDAQKLYDYSIDVVNRWSDYRHRFYAMLNK